MVVRRLLGAVVDGVGLTAGAALFRELDRDPEPEGPPEDPRARDARLVREAKAAKAAAEKAAEEAARARKKRDREIEGELSALKKKLARERR
ncbi:MAG: hypothetical protein JNL38_16420 [Myxococcales bacterium]|nr:hypothetical protein [Myxococcales bacterium]